MNNATCGHCGRETSEPLNRFGIHDYCTFETEESEEGEEQ